MFISKIFKKIVYTLRSNIKYKMFIVYVLVITIPILIFSIISYRTSSLRIQSDFIKYKENINRQIVKNIDENIKNLSRQSMAIYANMDDILNVLGKPADIQDIDYLKSSKRVSNYLQSILQGNDKIFGISLIALNGEVKFCFTKQDAPLNLYRAQSEKWFKNALSLKGNFLLREPHYNEFIQKSDFSDDLVISVVRAIVDFETNRVEGILLIDQNINQFSGILSGMEFETNETVAVLGKTNNIIYSNKPSDNVNLNNILPLLNSKNSGTITMDLYGKKMLVSFFKSQEFHWKVLSLLPLSELDKKSSFLKRINISLLLILFVFIFIISIFISYLITIPLKKLTSSFKMLQKGDFTVDVPVKGMDELAQIGKTFNSMVASIKNLIEQRYELSILRKQAELESLQSQINPHFLFNTLNSIKSVADEGNISKVGVMVKHLSDTFRYSLSRGRQIVSFSEELEQIRKYLFIQSCRFPDKYEVYYDIDSEVLDYDIPRLTLQPIVENAIYHGLERKIGKGELRIAAKAINDMYYVFISNNGVYISKEELERINTQLESNPEILPNQNPEKLGVYNVNARIKFHFGNDYGMRFSSSEGSFTTVKITLPIKKQ